MRFRGLLSAAGALTLSFGATPAFADQPTPIHLVEVYDITPGEFATHEVTLSTAVPLVAQQCQSMGAGAQASSATLTDVDGVPGCHFTWELEDAGVEVVTIDDGGVFHFHSVSASLLEGFSTPEAVATIDSVTLVAHASTIVEASAGGAITSAGASTKTDASTVTWLNVNEDVNATGTVDPSAVDVASSPSPAAALPVAPQEPRGGGLLSSLALIVAITGGVVVLAFIGAIARWVGRSRQASADAQFERDAFLRAAQREAALDARTASSPYACARSAPEGSALAGVPRAPEDEASALRSFAPPTAE